MCPAGRDPHGLPRPGGLYPGPGQLPGAAVPSGCGNQKPGGKAPPPLSGIPVHCKHGHGPAPAGAADVGFLFPLRHETRRQLLRPRLRQDRLRAGGLRLPEKPGAHQAAGGGLPQERLRLLDGGVCPVLRRAGGAAGPKPPRPRIDHGGGAAGGAAVRRGERESDPGEL